MQQKVTSFLIIGIFLVTSGCGVKGKPLPPLKKGEPAPTNQQISTQ